LATGTVSDLFGDQTRGEKMKKSKRRLLRSVSCGLKWKRGGGDGSSETTTEMERRSRSNAKLKSKGETLQ